MFKINKFINIPYFFIFGGQVVAPETTVVKDGRMTLRLDIPRHLPVWMQKEIIGVEVWQFIAAFLFILLGMVLKKISDEIFEKKLIPIFKRTRVDIDNLFLEALSKPFGMLILLGGIAIAFAILPLPTQPDIDGFIFETFKILFAFDFLWFLFRIVDIGVKYLTRLAERTESKLDEQLVPMISRAIKATIGAISFLWIIQLLGYNISSLLAGLGIGGLAVALGLQDTIANFFGSVFIFLDRPFIVGDIVKIADVEGTFEDVGFRSTRIRTFPATLVSIPNKTVSNAVIDNLSRRPKRRVFHTIGVTYETNAAQMELAVAGIKDIIEKDEGVDKDVIIVKFSEFGDSSLDIMVLYYTLDVSFAEHFKTKERINLAIMKKLEELGLSIAFPTRSIYIENHHKNGGNVSESEKKLRKARKENKEDPLPF